MWVLILLFALTTLLLGWICFLYFIVLYWIGRFRVRPALSPPEPLPFVSVVVPCFNEAEGILDKVDNLRALDYPRDRLEVVFADGGSTDGTVARLREAVAEPWMRIRTCAGGGKIPQVNEVLPLLAGEIVVLTDADAALAPDALRMIAAEMAAAPDVGVVGAFCRPENVTGVDRHFWVSQNRGRLLESDACSSSIVVAPCYAFRRDLFARFPDDVVADDIYAACCAHAAGLRVVYSRRAVAVERRGPRTLQEFLPHKFRKSNAYLRETLRFLYRLPEMGFFAKTMLLTRLCQQVLMPWALLLWALLAGALLTLFRFDVVFLAAGALAALALATGFVFWRVRLPAPEPPVSFLDVGLTYILSNVILLSTALSYPFYRQESRYARVGRPAAARDADAPASSSVAAG